MGIVCRLGLLLIILLVCATDASAADHVITPRSFPLRNRPILSSTLQLSGLSETELRNAAPMIRCTELILRDCRPDMEFFCQLNSVATVRKLSVVGSIPPGALLGLSKLRRLMSVHFESLDHSIDCVLSACGRLDDVEELSFAWCWGMSDHAGRVLGKLVRLTTFKLEGCFDITLQGVDALTTMPRLRRLALSSVGLQDRALESVCRLAALTDLDISGNLLITQKSLLKVGNLNMLQRIDLSHLREVDDAVLASIARGAPHLVSVAMNGENAVSVTGFKYLTRLPLRELVIRDSAVSSDIVVEVASACPALEVLILDRSGTSRNRLSRNALNGLAGHGFLKVLSLRNQTGLGAEAQGVIGSLRSLQELNVSGCWAFGDDLTDRLLTMIGLRSLNMSGCAVTDKGAARLSRISSLRVLNLSRTLVTDESILHLAHLKLECVRLNYCNISERTINALANCRSLTELSVGNCLGIRWHGLNVAPRWRIRRIDLLGTDVTDAGIASLCVDSCQIVIVSDCALITDETIGVFARLPQLAYVDISGCEGVKSKFAQVTARLRGCIVRRMW